MEDGEDEPPAGHEAGGELPEEQRHVLQVLADEGTQHRVEDPPAHGQGIVEIGLGQRH